MLSLPINAIIFDLDGTLRHNIPSADDTQFYFANQLGASVPGDLQILGARWAHYYWAQSFELLRDIEEYGDKDGDFWVNYSYRYLLSLTVPEERANHLAPLLAAQMELQYTPENYVFPETPNILQTLKSAGFTLGLVSNRSNPCHEECETLGLLQYFDFAYVAAEVDAWKPDPRIFDRALKMTHASPERIIYIGDNYYADIMGARKAGLQPVLLDEKGIFPEAECPVISKLGELVGMVFEE
jgi:HAD superfamily hydrolase (TIGR01549 family)